MRWRVTSNTRTREGDGCGSIPFSYIPYGRPYTYDVWTDPIKVSGPSLGLRSEWLKWIKSIFGLNHIFFLTPWFITIPLLLKLNSNFHDSNHLNWALLDTKTSTSMPLTHCGRHMCGLCTTHKYISIALCRHNLCDPLLYESFRRLESSFY